MSAIVSSPTHAGRLRLISRLDTARHAADLLRNKEEVLERERARLEGHTARAEADWRERCSEAAPGSYGPAHSVPATRSAP